ncbi:TonB-dependent receptor plug domain-containing protein (plasmid) [Sphingomonas sp. NY01]|uniref:TonB-dependent receptor plug domain-containing protein n=1 Tax=Sphingomonas sp. NY01 TaxID=2968057 RepID=UPI00315DA052
MKLRVLLMASACIAATSISMPASAQVTVQSPIPPRDPETPATSAAPTPDGPIAPANANPVVQSTSQEGDIVVTAQRRSESIQTVPVSVTAIGAQDLKERGINDLQQIGLVAPSLQVNNNTNFSVRGIGTLSFSTALDTSVAISLDDVNLGKPLLSAIPFYDISQIEVLNGPQGLLFGKNASAGLLNIVTNKPEIGSYAASFDMEADNRTRPGDDARGALTRVALNIPVTANSALR